MELFMFAHGGSGNHGCEAIVRSTCQIFADADKLLYSYRPDEDHGYGIEQVCRILDDGQVAYKRWSLRFLAAYAQLKLRRNDIPLLRYNESCHLACVPKGAVALSIGGDNYCYQGLERFTLARKQLQKAGTKVVLWGCSVEPELLDPVMQDDLGRYDLITARESITYEALRKINPNTILAPDPAFTLEKRPGEYPHELGGRPYIGLNVSPLVQTLERSGNITLENYQRLIQWILMETNCDIALIPHVVWDHNDDRIPLGQLYEQFKDTGRVYMVEDQNCMQLKDIISGCEFFVGARTHSTIAAYSTCVPTLVVGYSVKARGIARDLFGTEDGYVLPVQQLKEKDDLTNAFKTLYARKEDIRKHLTDMMPGYIRGIDAAREAVENL